MLSVAEQEEHELDRNGGEQRDDSSVVNLDYHMKKRIKFVFSLNSESGILFKSGAVFKPIRYVCGRKLTEKSTLEYVQPT